METKAKSTEQISEEVEASAAAPAPEKKRRTRKASPENAAPEAAAEKAPAPAKRSRAPKAAAAAVVYLQYEGGEREVSALVEAAKADFTANNPGAEVKEVKLYLKPEDGAAYYVVNGDVTGKIAL